jgi:hypothetical protein
MAAEEILRFALFKEVLKPERRKKRKLNTGKARGSNDGDSDDDTDDEDEVDKEIDENEADDVVTARTETRDARTAARAKRMETPRASVPRSAQGDDADADAEAEAAWRDSEAMITDAPPAQVVREFDAIAPER